MQELSLMERFADPTLFNSLTMGEKMTASLVATLMGMGVTFTILFLLWGIIAIMARIMKTGNNPPKKKAETEKATSVSDGQTMTMSKQAPHAESGGSPELIAVIMAAIAAQEGLADVGGLVIRKINRISGGQTAWRSAGSAECIDSRKL